MDGLKSLDLFSGIGGFALAAERAGIETAAFCEIDKFPQSVLKYRYPDIPVIDDVRKLTKGKVMTDYGCMLRGYSRPVVNAILDCREQGKFIPMLAMSFSRRSVEVYVKHAERAAGESK